MATARCPFPPCSDSSGVTRNVNGCKALEFSGKYRFFWRHM
jgi:hypothetical protein